MASPFFKCAGGKRQLLPELMKHVPREFGRYFEPFVGGGAFFFALQAAGRISSATLNDANPHMIAAYRTVRGDVGTLIAALRAHAAGYSADREAFYYARRAENFDPGKDEEHAAARFLFLNKTCFNGLWRVNKAGRFNVPHGRYANPAILDATALLEAHRALQNVDLRCCDFAQACKPTEGDFWYADPPYWPASSTADFTAYAKAGFGPIEQGLLRDNALRLKDQGVHVLLSNADVEPVRKLYAKGFEMRRVEARRNINVDGKKRGKVGELLIW